MQISRPTFLITRNVSDKSYRENQSTSYVKYYFFANFTVCEVMWKTIALPDRPEMKVWRMRIPCWIPKATNTHSEYVILIAVPLQL